MAELLLEPGKLGILQLEQALRFVKLPLECGDALLQRRALACRRTARATGTGLRGRHEAQAAAVATAGPCAVLRAHFGPGLGGPDGRQRRLIGQLQRGAGMQFIHVAAESRRVRLKQRHQGALALRIRIMTRRNRRERLAALDDVVAAARARGRRRTHRRTGNRRSGGGVRCGLGSRRRGRSRPIDAAGARLWRFGGRSHGRRGTRLVAREYRRIEQHGIFTHQPAAGPAGLNQQRCEGFGDDARRVHLQYVMAVGGLAGHEGHRIEKRRIIEAVAGKTLAARQCDLETPDFLGGRREVDIGIKRRIQGRFKVYIPQSQRHRSGGQQPGQNQGAYDITQRHQISQWPSRAVTPLQNSRLRCFPWPSGYMAGNITYKYSRTKISAIWTAFVAAPLRILSPTTHRSRPRSWVISSRMRPT